MIIAPSSCFEFIGLSPGILSEIDPEIFISEALETYEGPRLMEYLATVKRRDAIETLENCPIWPILVSLKVTCS